MKIKLLFIFIGLLNTLSGCVVKHMIDIVKVQGKSEPSQKQYIETIPFQYIANHIVVEASVNNEKEKHKFIFDTGAPTLISDDFRKKYNPAFISIFRDTSFAAKFDERNDKIIKSIFPTIDKLILGDFAFENVGSRVFDINRVGKVKCYADAGVIGANVMNDGIWQIDYSAKKISFTDNMKHLQHIDSSYIIKFKTSPITKTPLVDININGQVFTMIFDTGSARKQLFVSKEQSRRFMKALSGDRIAELKMWPPPTVYSDGSSNVINAQLALVPKLEMGKLVIKDAEIMAVDLPFFSKKIHGVIGNELLKNYIVTINWKNKTIYMKPDVPVLSARSFLSEFGFEFEFEFENKLFVRTVKKSAFGNEVSLDVGDEIIAINGIPTDSLSSDQVCDLYVDLYVNIVGSVSSEVNQITLSIRHQDGRTGTYTIKREPLFPNLNLDGSSSIVE